MERRTAAGKLLRQAGLLYRYLRDPRVPALKKGLLGAAFFYILSPFDLAPELLSFFGLVDDAVVAALLWRFLTKELAAYRRK